MSLAVETTATASAACASTGPHLHLSTFGPTSLAAWFAMGQVIRRNITDEMHRYYHMLLWSWWVPSLLPEKDSITP